MDRVGGRIGARIVVVENWFEDLTRLASADGAF